MMRLVRRPTSPKPSKGDILAAILREVSGQWTVARLRALTLEPILPSEMVDTISRYMAKYPACISVTEDEFIAAMATVRKDLVPILETEAGRAWLRKVPARMAERLAAVTIRSMLLRGVADG